MAPEETADAASLLWSFERRFLAARSLRSFPWQVGGRVAVEKAGRGPPGGSGGTGFRAYTLPAT
uniref:FAM86 N-terminal domain-containing protein n=1 Tax=Catagonus wagneri TaxID=51154 RepID=A0A8C3WFX4_9CETA